MSKEELVYNVFQNIADGYDDANMRISLGLHKSWKRMLTDRLVRSLPAKAHILDVCCGTGDIALEMAGRRPDLKVTGIDFSPAMLQVAGERKGGLENVRFLQGDAMNLPFRDNTFAAACISFGLRNTGDYEKTLMELRRVVKNGGYIYCLDSFVPEMKVVRPFYRMYFKYAMPLLGGGKEHMKEYMWLYESTNRFLAGSELAELMRETGLENVRIKERMFGACNLIWGQK